MFRNGRIGGKQIIIFAALIVVGAVILGVAIGYGLATGRIRFPPVGDPTLEPYGASTGVPTTTATPELTAPPTYAYLPTITAIPSPTAFSWRLSGEPKSSAQDQASPYAGSQTTTSSGQQTTSSSTCAAALDYAAAMHQYNLDMIDYVHYPLISYYRQLKQYAVRERDAYVLVDAQRRLEAEQTQVEAEKSSENKRYRAEVARINAAC